MRARNIQLIWVLILLVYFFVQSCQVQDTIPISPKPYVLDGTQQLEDLATDSPTPSKELPTNTASPSAAYTPSPSPTLTMTSTVLEKIQVIQNEVIDWKASHIDFTGSIVLSGDYVSPLNPEIDQLDQDSVILNLQTKERIILAKAGEDPIFVYHVSPDGRWLAYYVLEPKEIIITSSDGQEVTRFSLQKEWGHNGLLWLNNDTLAISQSLPRPDIKEDTKGVAGLYALNLYNPFTQEIRTLMPDYPGISSIYTSISWYLSGMLPDPTMQYLVYPNDGYEDPFVLWDISGNKETATFPWGSYLQWSPDGNKLVYVRDEESDFHPDDELFSVDLQGTIFRLTNLNDKYSEVYIDVVQWSPDGKKIAFWFSTDESRPGGFYIGVLDIETGKIKIYSYENFEGSNQSYLNRRIDQSPIWSPDSCKLLVVGINPDDENQRDILVIDLETDTMVKIAENMIPVGWMK